MGKFRVTGVGKSHYHTWSRCIDGRYFFKDDRVKTVIRRMIRNLSCALDVEVVTWCIMSNHYHLLLTIPDKPNLDPLSEEQWLEKLACLYDVDEMADLRRRLQLARDIAESAEAAEQNVAKILQTFEDRRADLSNFMKELNQRISIYINDRFKRRGPLWESPFGRLLIEGNQGHLLKASAYIDLNPVRAKMVERPEDYRFCGYAEAVSGNTQARNGLGTILTESLQDESFRSDWRRTHRRYRLVLYTEGQAIESDPENGITGRAGFTEQQVEKVEQAEGEMTVPEVLRHRVRYFCDGVAIGSQSFIETIFQQNRHRFGRRRQAGARAMRGAQWGNMYCLRDLRRDVIGP